MNDEYLEAINERLARIENLIMVLQATIDTERLEYCRNLMENPLGRARLSELAPNAKTSDRTTGQFFPVNQPNAEKLVKPAVPLGDRTASPHPSGITGPRSRQLFAFLEFAAYLEALGLALALQLHWIKTLNTPDQCLYINMYGEAWPEIAIFTIAAAFFAYMLAGAVTRLKQAVQP